MEWPKNSQRFLEESVVINYIKTLAKAGRMKANIADFISDTTKTYLYTGGAKLSNVIKKRNKR